VVLLFPKAFPSIILMLVELSLEAGISHRTAFGNLVLLQGLDEAHALSLETGMSYPTAVENLILH
jgi:hypothetical protein